VPTLNIFVILPLAELVFAVDRVIVSPLAVGEDPIWNAKLDVPPLVTVKVSLFNAVATAPTLAPAATPAESAATVKEIPKLLKLNVDVVLAATAVNVIVCVTFPLPIVRALPDAEIV
jgi:hypothetical protein